MTALAWLVMGSLGAAVAFAVHAWPSVGPRMKNIAVAMAAGGASAALSPVFPMAWRLGAGWIATALVLQWSHPLFPAGRWIGVRMLLAAGLVIGVGAAFDL